MLLAKVDNYYSSDIAFWDAFLSCQCFQKKSICMPFNLTGIYVFN